ncbi:hypothetical protein HMPREF1624_01331 [Sporothrix schenckii ATCC 58251]|uniref:Uncharacterized protein n=1 Tax=Sporothrix schenckii (strain ATCC 58251 / de Perez 2211183) TaxID=1391915 RepID=U7Q761_SPOS1|nr:hypothetical protein HMPREF1624_01331 [Sporothrix schenckii ATCC 58251]
MLSTTPLALPIPSTLSFSITYLNMLLLTLAVVIAAAAQASGFKIPKNQPDGVYIVTVDAGGTEEHIRIGDSGNVPTVNIKETHDKALQEPNRIQCFNQHMVLNAANTDAANNALDVQCGSYLGVDGNKSIYSKSGCVVAYYCNWNSNSCDVPTRQLFSAKITDRCGRYIPGTATFDDQQRTHFAYGYRDVCEPQSGDDFCGY